ncbi:MAG TPA: TonB family protein [Terracidiphilus sp.]|jgi:TonB family protein
MVCEGWEGSTIDGKFPLLEWLGGWADRCVFLTVRQGTQRANIKLILASGGDAEAHLANWVAAKAQSHLSLTQLMETGRSTIHGADVVYLVTEKADAFLSGIIPRKALNGSEVKAIFDPVVDALSYLHEKGLAHGSVKPANIVRVGEQWKLGADEMEGSGEFAKTGRKPDGYDAPEVAEGKITPAADIWSLGIIAVEAFAQKVPVWDRDAKADLGVPVWVMPEPFREMARGCLRWEPADRISIADVRALLTRSTDTSPAAEPIPAPVVKEIGADQRKREEPAAAKPVDLFPKPEPVEFAPRSRMFSNLEDEPEHTGRKGSIVVAVLVLLAIVAVVAVRGFRGRFFLQNVPAESRSTPPKPPAPQNEAGQGQTPANASQPAPSQPQGASAEGQSTPPTHSAPESQAPEPQTSSEAAKPQEPAESAPAKSSPATKPETSAPESKVETTTPPAADSKGAVVKRVLPNVESGASESMRRVVDVELRVSVNEDGKVSNVEYMTQGAGNYFARKALQAAKGWTFKPPQSDGQAASSEWVLLFRFERRKIDVTATELR